MAFHNIPPNGFPDIPDMEELEAVVKDVNSLKTSVSGLETDVSNLSDNKANQITIAPFFDPETSYEVGDLVYYNGLSYRCTNDHEGEWDADDFASTTIAVELDSLKSGLIDLHLTKVHELVPVTTTVTSTEINSINGYSALLFIAQVNGTVRGTLYLPYSVVSSGVDMYIPVAVGSTQESIYIKYVDDTHISISSTTATLNYLMICGTK